MIKISIKDLYDTLLDLISKNNGEYIGIEEFNRYVPQALNELYDDLVGSKNNPRVVYGKNRITDRRLNGFRRNTPAITVPATGVIQLPKDLGFIRTVLHGEEAVRPIDEDRVGKLSTDTLASPNEDDKYYVELGYNGENEEIKILNKDIDSVVVQYLVRPNKPKYAVKMEEVGGRQRPVYDSDNSIDIIGFDEREMSEIINRILPKIGLTMRDQYVNQVAQNSKLEE